jgi:hypothetical protein
MSNNQQQELLIKKRLYESLITSRIISAREIDLMFQKQPTLAPSPANQAISRQTRQSINLIHLQCQAMIAEYDLVIKQLQHS